MQEMRQNARDLLSRTRLFSACPPDMLDRLAQGAAFEPCKKGQVVFINGDDARHYFLVRKGWIKLFRETLDGDQAIIDILPAGQLFGETAIFEQGAYTCSAETIEEGEILRLPMQALRREMETSNTMALSMLKSMNRYRHEQDMEIEHRTLQNAPQRIGCFLLRLLDQYRPGPALLHLPYDKTLLAARLGMQPETFSRALARLRDETGLVIRGSAIEIASVDQLAQFSCPACSSGFPCADR